MNDRDELAKAAMVGLLAGGRGKLPPRSQQPREDAKQTWKIYLAVAFDAHAMADAMLATRKEPPHAD